MSEDVVEASFNCVLGKEALLFRRMNVVESLNAPTDFQLEVMRLSSKVWIDPKKLLGTQATVTLLLRNGSKRYFNAWIVTVAQGEAVGRFDTFILTLHTWTWHLGLSVDNRIFQDKTAVEILDEVFADYSSQQVSKKLKGSYRKRPYCVQYRETDLDFVHRLMEDEGIYYFFTHQDGQHTLVLCDDPSCHELIQPDDTLGYAAARTSNERGDAVVDHWQLSRSVHSLKYSHVDHDQDSITPKPINTAQSTASFANPGRQEVYEWPSEYSELEDKSQAASRATAVSKLRVQGFESGQVKAVLETPCRSVGAGRSFKFVDHRDRGEYLITYAELEMDFGRYESTDDEPATGFSAKLEAMPKAQRYVPDRRTHNPRIHGVQTAVVVGASGDEIHTDKTGRVKVKFPWDRKGKGDEKSSCWVRVAQPWASKGFGMFALPRVGDEVVIEFLEGNPDRPLITGSVYSPENLPAYTLPDHATVTGIRSRSSKGGTADTFNELRFDDKKDAEHVYFQAQKDLHQNVKNDAHLTIGNDHWTEVVKNAQHQVGENQTVTVGKISTLKIGTDSHTSITGDQILKTGGLFDGEITGAVQLKGADAISLSAGQAMDVKVGQALTVGASATLHLKANSGIVIDGGTEITLKAGGAFIKIGPEGVTIQGPLVKINSGGAPGNANQPQAAQPAQPQEPGEHKSNDDPLQQQS